MGLSWREWHKSDLIYAIIAPVLVVLVIVGFSRLGSLFEGGFGIAIGKQWRFLS